MASRHSGAVGEMRATPLTLVDSCVLLDIATDDPKWADWSDEALARACDEGGVVINLLVLEGAS